MAGVGPKPPAPPDEQILSEAERREVLALVQDNNISMDFILEMKEAFLLFDKVLEICKTTFNCVAQKVGHILPQIIFFCFSERWWFYLCPWAWCVDAYAGSEPHRRGDHEHYERNRRWSQWEARLLRVRHYDEGQTQWRGYGAGNSTSFQVSHT